MSSVIEFNGITKYDIDIQPHGVYLTVHSDAGSHQIRVNCNTIKKSETKPVQPNSPVINNKLQQNQFTRQVKPSQKPASYWKSRFEKKLSDKDVLEIRALWPQVYEEYKTSKASSLFLAELYNCSAGTIIGIVKNQTRKQVSSYDISKETNKEG